MNMKTNQSDTKEIQFSQGQKKKEQQKNERKQERKRNTKKNDYYANAGN